MNISVVRDQSFSIVERSDMDTVRGASEACDQGVLNVLRGNKRTRQRRNVPYVIVLTFPTKNPPNGRTAKRKTLCYRLSFGLVAFLFMWGESTRMEKGCQPRSRFWRWRSRATILPLFHKGRIVAPRQSSLRGQAPPNPLFLNGG